MVKHKSKVTSADRTNQKISVKNKLVKHVKGPNNGRVIESAPKIASREQVSSVANNASSGGTASIRNLSALQSKFAKKLEGGRFRYINEKLYKSTGIDIKLKYGK